MKRTTWKWITLFATLAILVSGLRTADASFLVPQTPIPGKSLTKYLNPLPFFGPAGVVPRVNGTVPYAVTYNEFQQGGDLSLAPLYTGFFPGTATAITGTLVWGYNVGGTVANWPGVTVEADVSAPTQVTYRNTLPVSGSLLQRYVTVDQTLHWADPLQAGMVMAPYIGPPPVVAHLHGGVTPSAFDGGPDQWFTPAGGLYPNGIHGPGFRTISGAAANEAIYRYPNIDQEPATLWFHEHTLGATRTNVFSGLAAYYFLRGFNDDGAGGAGKLPDAAHEIEIALQDRMFDTQGQLFFPDVGINPEHPFWVPEFIGDVITVNGKVWPTLTVDPRRYRFRLLEGSNARFYNLSFQAVGAAQGAKKPVPVFWVIGTDGGFLDYPVAAPQLLFAPGERYDTIVDFTAFAGQTFLIINNARAPYPGGTPASPSTVGQIMQIVVNPTPVADNSYNPAADGAIRDAAGNQLPINLSPIVRLAGFDAVNKVGTGTLAAGVTPLRVRQLTLNEILGPGGPLEVILNNSKWTGIRPDGTVNADAKPLTISSDGRTETYYLTELPQVGSTEVWEIINLTADSHPIHLHEFQFQLLNRQALTLGGSKGYLAAYNAAFPGGVFTPAYGPPFAYNTGQGNETFTRTDATTISVPIIGGNPNVIPFLAGLPLPPLPHEVGWKDTFIMHPGQVTRIVARWTPQNILVGNETPGTSQFSFEPQKLGNPSGGVVTSATNPEGPGYVWHCHIVDHEDNEMMRPYVPVTNANNALP